jgi:hypothetical protein
VEVIFATRTLMDDLVDPVSRANRFGTPTADRIELRLIQLFAAVCLDDIRALPGRCTELPGKPRGRLVIDLAPPHQLLIRPTSKDAGGKGRAGGLDWTSIHSITLIDVIAAA